MLGLFRKRRRLDILETELMIKEREATLSMIDKALEARNLVVDDEKGWDLIGGRGAPVTEEEHKVMLEKSYKFYHTNPHARSIVRTLVKFTLGIGPTIEPEEENEKTKKKIKEVWKDFAKRNKFNKREKEIATRVFRDGENFLRVFLEKSNGDINIRFIRSSRIAKPDDKEYNERYSHGIKTKEEDIETPVSYTIVDVDGKLVVELKAEEVIHTKILSDSDQKRGISVFKVVAKRLTQYEEWLEDRIVLNKIRSAIALVRQVDSSAPKVKEIRDENLSDRLSGTRKKQKMMNRGTVITASRGVEYKMLSPQINASDVVEDGRSMLLSVAAGVGFPEMIMTSDYSNANFASTLIAQNPFVREIEEWQDFFKDFYKDLYELVIKSKVAANKLPDDTSTECKVKFPPMIYADLEKLAKAFEILFKYKIVSRRTWRGEMGLDTDAEDAYIEDEEGDPLYTPPAEVGADGKPITGKPGQGKPGGASPFNLPIAPVNQFGAKAWEMIKKADWEGLIELAEEVEADESFVVESTPSDNGQEGFREWLTELLETVVNTPQPDININVETPDVTVTTPDVHVTSPDINITTPDIKVEPKIVVEAAEVKVEPNITVEQPSITLPENKIEIPETKVVVEGANINVEAPPPAEVKVDVHVPERRLVKKKIIKDGDGEVTGIEETT